MLVLTRLKDERVLLFQDGKLLLSVQIVDIRGNEKVRLGFDAPPNIDILREEIVPPAQEPASAK